MDYEEKFRTVISEMEKAGFEYADAKALSWHLQEMRKVIISNQMKSAPGKSMAEKELIARTSQEYLTHLEGTKVAISNELRAKAKYEKLSASYEALRSLSSQETARMKI